MKYTTLRKAVKEGRISEKRLHESLRRILRVKRRGILNHKLSSVSKTLASLKKGKHRLVTRTIAQKALTMVSNPDGILPLKTQKKIVVASTEPAFMSTDQIPGTQK